MVYVPDSEEESDDEDLLVDISEESSTQGRKRKRESDAEDRLVDVSEEHSTQGRKRKRGLRYL